jgi:hypothetical protein
LIRILNNAVQPSPLVLMPQPGDVAHSPASTNLNTAVTRIGVLTAGHGGNIIIVNALILFGFGLIKKRSYIFPPSAAVYNVG